MPWLQLQGVTATAEYAKVQSLQGFTQGRHVIRQESSATLRADTVLLQALLDDILVNLMVNGQSLALVGLLLAWVHSTDVQADRLPLPVGVDPPCQQKMVVPPLLPLGFPCVNA